ncbi:MAG: SRPBCC domain-containing protein [Ignavibacteriaceae bacterium]|nr:SRPBCC domain-containing protein [Ignavibacteriaceae bacterium]
MAAIKHLLIINSHAEIIYSAITTKRGIANWWTEQTEVGSKLGDFNTFDFGDQYHNEMKITDLVFNKRVEWECVLGDKEWIGTKIVFEIEEKDDRAVLKFTHGNWREETDFFASCNYQWGYYMNSLKQYCETGKGNQFQNK